MSLLKRRLERISVNMKSAYEDSAGYVSPVTGREREVFIHSFLRQMLPPSMRIGSGVISDVKGNETGQLDIVLELPLSVSFPIAGENRHYLADSVGAVIEVKSSLNKQWGEVVEKAKDVQQISRFAPPEEDITFGHDLWLPFFVVGFRGPQKHETIEGWLGKLEARFWPSGIYVVESDLFIGQGPAGWLYASGQGGAPLAFIAQLFSRLNGKRDSSVNFNGYAQALYPSA